MTIFVVTIPGTFLADLTPAAHQTLLSRLSPADPQTTTFGEAEDLALLTLYSGTKAFSLRLEVEADDTTGAEDEARRIAADALQVAGFTEAEAPLGDAVITGIDS
ncbi:hypothetical protein [Streptomyces beijiangensis]|uniref:Uncharacterized protein n=1 Tax=Streptomyces beijiangensis TaxID=163361 RepID=A0A939F690_9ACTN|nr:hypothetical protein [Streptomyces beijiangensis]MBO0511155.1 hypothetical protein [Streptomyces beijiangensis]